MPLSGVTQTKDELLLSLASPRILQAFPCHRCLWLDIRDPNLDPDFRRAALGPCLLSAIQLQIYSIKNVIKYQQSEINDSNYGSHPEMKITGWVINHLLVYQYCYKIFNHLTLLHVEMHS